MTEFDRVQTRLENLQSVQPILGALRTISLGSWQAAQKRRQIAQQYEQALFEMLPWILPYLTQRNLPRHHLAESNQRIVLAVGSERGLCGRFNVVIAEKIEAYLAHRTQPPEIQILGSRLHRLLQRQLSLPMTMTIMPKNVSTIMHLAFHFTHQWLRQYEVGAIDSVEVIYNAYLGLGQHKPTIKQLVPPVLSPVSGIASADAWPPPLIETDPNQLITHIIRQAIALSFYDCLLESVAAEQALRYQRMEAATQNAKRLVDDLTVTLQTARQQAITQEMQTLATGAGLIR